MLFKSCFILNFFKFNPLFSVMQELASQKHMVISSVKNHFLSIIFKNMCVYILSLRPCTPVFFYLWPATAHYCETTAVSCLIWSPGVRSDSGLPERRWPVTLETQSQKEGFQAHQGRSRSSPLSCQSHSVAGGGVFSMGIFFSLLALGMNLYQLP